MAVVVKFKRRVARAKVEEARGALSARFGRRFEPLFPDDPDPDLAAMYTIDVPDSQAKSLIRLLTESPSVEYAEATPARKLVHPVR